MVKGIEKDFNSTTGFPRVVMAGTHSGVGKTTLTIGLMAALKERGRVVQGFKVGPDYIDPTYHTAITGFPSRNLDRWMLQDNLNSVYLESGRDRWSVIEGVMGMFDGMKGTQGFGSTADIAKELNAPVILIVDGSSMARSVAAIVQGFTTFDPDVNLAGVILNRVKSSSHEHMLREALAEIACPVLGVIPQGALIKFPERHLGLVPIGENQIAAEDRQTLIRTMTECLDLARIEEIMRGAPDLPDLIQPDKPVSTKAEKVSDSGIINSSAKKTKVLQSKQNMKQIGIAWDEAFLFYYQDALETLKKVGFNLISFSPLHDSDLPPHLDGLILGGGFPELHLEKLSANQGMVEGIRRWGETGKPIYAECGGFMYLGESITDFAGNDYPGIGLIPMTTQMTSRLQGMGYREGVLQRDTFLGPQGTVVKGHEFHYSRAVFNGEAPAAYSLFKGGELLKEEGYYHNHIFGSYLHLNFAGQPELMANWIAWWEKQ